MRNKDIHDAFSDAGIKKWLVAEKLGISDVTFSKKLRKELSRMEKIKIIKIIEDLRKETKEEKI